jgi:quinone-modifying oxidoreductase subunit QmoC
LHLLDPVKILGNAGAATAFAGVTWIVARRIFGKSETGNATYCDWTFILALYLAVLSGIGAELARLADMPGAAYPVYFTHLTLVFFLLAYMPFSKFSHMLYRAAAMVFAKASGRNRK